MIPGPPLRSRPSRTRARSISRVRGSAWVRRGRSSISTGTDTRTETTRRRTSSTSRPTDDESSFPSAVRIRSRSNTPRWEAVPGLASSRLRATVQPAPSPTCSGHSCPMRQARRISATFMPPLFESRGRIFQRSVNRGRGADHRSDPCLPERPRRVITVPGKSQEPVPAQPVVNVEILRPQAQPGPPLQSKAEQDATPRKNRRLERSRSGEEFGVPAAPG